MIMVQAYHSTKLKLLHAAYFLKYKNSLKVRKGNGSLRSGRRHRNPGKNWVRGVSGNKAKTLYLYSAVSIILNVGGLHQCSTISYELIKFNVPKMSHEDIAK